MILLLLASLFGCSSGADRCDIVALTTQRAGLGAVDCGIADVGDDAAVHACVVQAFEDGVAFRGLVQTPGQGSLTVRGWVSNGESVELVLADFEGCDDRTCQGSVVAVDCTDAEVREVAGTPQVACSWTEPPCGLLLCGFDPGCIPP